MKTLLILISAILITNYSYSQSGTLDNTFGTNGKVTTSVNSFSGGEKMAIQADGKIVIAGHSADGSVYHFALVRYNTNGTLDSTFDGDGQLVTTFSVNGDRASAIALQNDGKIVVAGFTLMQDNSSGFAVARYNIDGSLDASFDGDGKQTTVTSSEPNGATAVAIQSDGKIVVAGSSGIKPVFTLVRYNSNGSLDLSLNGTGIVLTDMGSEYGIANDMVLQSDGKIILAGTFKSGNSSGQGNQGFAIARYNIDGTLDSNFDNDGKVFTTITSSDDRGYSVALQGDGKIVVGGHNINHFILARYNPDGSLDLNFDNDGKVIAQLTPYDDYGHSMALQSDGKILMAGDYISTGSNVLLVRFNSNGSLDNSFDYDGMVSTPFGNHTTIRSVKPFGNRIYVAGISDNKFAVVAYQNASIALPITLTNFAVTLRNHEVDYQWETAQEMDASHFIVQRSFSGTQFKDVGRVNALGYPGKYLFKDVNLIDIMENKSIFYRLKMVDKSGKTILSSIAKISLEGASLIQIYPNPAHDYLMVKGKNIKEIKVTDANGRLVMAKNTTISTGMRMNISHLSKGFYTIVIKDKDGAVQTKNFSIQ